MQCASSSSHRCATRRQATFGLASAPDSASRRAPPSSSTSCSPSYPASDTGPGAGGVPARTNKGWRSAVGPQRIVRGKAPPHRRLHGPHPLRVVRRRLAGGAVVVWRREREATVRAGTSPSAKPPRDSAHLSARLSAQLAPSRSAPAPAPRPSPRRTTAQHVRASGLHCQLDLSPEGGGRIWAPEPALRLGPRRARVRWTRPPGQMQGRAPRPRCCRWPGPRGQGGRVKVLQFTWVTARGPSPPPSHRGGPRPGSRRGPLMG